MGRLIPSIPETGTIAFRQLRGARRLLCADIAFALGLALVCAGCKHPIHAITTGNIFTESHVVSENEVVVHTPPVQNAGPLLEMPVSGEPWRVGGWL